MHPRMTTKAMLVALLLGSASPAAFAEPPPTAAPLFDSDEIERLTETGLFVDLEPAWPPLEPANRFAFGAPPALRDAKAPTFGTSETQSAIARAIKSGISVGVDTAELPAELKRATAFTDRLKGGIKAGFDAPMGEEMRLTTASVETQLALGGIGPSISWGWFTGVDMQAQRDGTNAIASGPQFKLGGDRLALTLNPKVAHGFGAHHDNEVAFAYTAGLKSELSKGLALGVEAFGTTSEIAPIPGMALNGHRSSQSLYVGVGLTPQKSDTQGSKFSLEVGALAGMTEATPDLTGRIKAGFTW